MRKLKEKEEGIFKSIHKLCVGSVLSKVVSIVFICIITGGLFLMNSGHITEEKVDGLPKLVVGTSADNPPYEYITNAEDGDNQNEIVGLDIDMARLLAKELNMELVIKNLDFVGLLPALMNGNVDVLIAGVSNTVERRKYVDFSHNYLEVKIAILHKNNVHITKPDDLANMFIGAQSGTTWEDLAHKYAAIYPNIAVESLSNNLMLIEQLKNDKLQAVLMEEGQVKKFAATYPNMKYLILPEESSLFAVVLDKNSPLKERINAAIATLKKRGDIRSLQKKWLNYESPEVPDNVDGSD